jgi:hypothetical protein
MKQNCSSPICGSRRSYGSFAQNLKGFFVFTVLLFSGSVWAGLPVEVLAPVDHVYAPKGFDSNDSTEIIVAGRLPNTCHKAPSATYEVVGGKILVTMKALSYQDSNPYCPPMSVPFVEPVNVGVLEKGSYQVVVNGQSEHEKQATIIISESVSPAVDDHVYAAVEYVERTPNTRTVTLKGYNPSDCYELDEVRMISNDVDTFSVLPVMKKVRSHCPMKMIPFNYEAQVPETLKEVDQVLLHVRVMNGKSVNALIRSND